MSRTSSVAFVGKGGAGKSTIAGTFARLLARSGASVLAVDSDPLPGMPYAVGIPIDDGVIPDAAVVAGPENGARWVLDPARDVESVIDRYSAVGPDGVRYLQFGNLRGHISTLQRSQHAWSQVVREVDTDRWHLVGDLPGGTRQAMSGWAKYADHVLVVVEPTIKSMHSARRLLNLSTATWAPTSVVLVANKVVDDSDLQLIEERLETMVAGAVPRDSVVFNGDRLGLAPLDVAPEGPFVAAVQDLVDHVTTLHYGEVGDRPREVR
jgi:CO dehydrogenase maturation factor